MSLSSEEKQLVYSVSVYGESYLRQRGWGPKRRSEFLQKKSVQDELLAIESQYADRDNLADRQRFFEMVEVGKMVPHAIQILRRALMEGEKLPDGRTVEPPTEGQLDAAKEILNRTKSYISKSDGDKLGINGDVTINSIGIGEAAGALALGSAARERLRSVAAALIHRNVAGHRDIKDAEVLSKGSVILKKKRKKLKALPPPKDA